MININLTDEEVKIIKESLNYIGDKKADSEGYSSGEKYWKLIEKLK